MRHVNLKPTLGDSVRAASTSGPRATRPHGRKVMQAGEDTEWVDADGVEHSVREIPDVLAALAAELETGVSTASKANTVSTASPPALADGYPPGAYWTRVEMVDGDLVERERWTVVDGAWTPVGLDASTLVAGTVNAGLIDAVALAARMVTAGLIRTAATGQRLEIDSGGLILYGLDADGEQYEMVRLGPSGVNLLTVGRTQIAPDSVTSPQGMFDELAVAGQPVADYVDARIRATGSQMVAIGGAGGSGNNIPVEANRKTGIFDLVMENIRHDAWYQATVDMTTYPRGASKAAELTMGLHHAPITMGVMYNSPILAERRSGPMSSTMWDHETLQFWFRGSQITSAPDGGSARLLLSALSDQRIDVNGDTTMVIEMIGPALPFSSTLNRGGTPLPGSTDTTVPPVSQVREYTKTYVATGSTTYYSSDNRVYTGSPDVIQGSYSGAAGDRRHGAWWFPSMTGDLAGATIKSVSIEATVNHTYASTGGTVRFYAHNGGNAAGGNIMNASFTAGQTRRLQIPAIHWDSVKNGSMKGFMVYTTSNSRVEYLRLNGGAGTARIHVTYEK